MTDNTWPATAKQRAFGIALERQLEVEASNWSQMNVSEASRRIDELKTLKDFRAIVGMPLAGHRGPVDEPKRVLGYGEPASEF